VEIAHVMPRTIGEKVAEGFAVRDALVHAACSFFLTA
jgi:hypothetical protein